VSRRERAGRESPPARPRVCRRPAH
jgi:hypothetical protein